MIYEPTGQGARLPRLPKVRASPGWDNTTRFWDGFNSQPLVTMSLPGFGGFSGDGTRVTVGGAIWEIAEGSECRTLHGHQGSDKGPWSIDFSPDSRLLATASGDGVRLWEAATGKELAWLAVG